MQSDRKYKQRTHRTQNTLPTDAKLSKSQIKGKQRKYKRERTNTRQSVKTLNKSQKNCEEETEKRKIARNEAKK